MVETNQKIVALKNKLLAREDKLAKLDKRIFSLRRDYKSVKKEIDEMNEEIRRLELFQLSETLEKNGITADDVAAAIADGSIKKTASNAENVALSEEKIDDVKEETANEISGS